MISVLEDMKKCYGCTACMNICPAAAISMKTDGEGFRMPIIDREKCVDCGMCRKVCPSLNAVYDNSDTPEIYGISADPDTLYDSSSGGAFTLLAEEILRRGGAVAGAAYDEDFGVHHVIITDRQDLDLIRRSKYSQSDQEDCYSRAKELLEAGTPVLYSGTPCQIAGLKCFLGKDYPSLITADLICHGIPSPELYKKHLAELAASADPAFSEGSAEDALDKVSSVEMRERKGWGTCFSVTLKDGTEITRKGSRDLFIKAFLLHLCMRRTCHGCAFARVPRQSDITIGDLWDARKKHLGSPYEEKSSIVLVNSAKGKEFWDSAVRSAERSVSVMSFGKEDVRDFNNNIYEPSADEDTALRDRFYENMKEMPFSEAVLKTLYQYDTGLVMHLGNNYGSIATNYALYKSIEKLGKRPVMLDSLVPGKGNMAKEFAAKHFERSSRILEKGDYRSCGILCDNFVLGSDQSLNWDLRHNIKHLEYMLLSFTPPEKRRIAYAPSFGSLREEIEDKGLRKAYASMLSRFSAFSVREEAGLKMSRELFSRDAELVSDPVFLLDRSDWLKLAEESEKKPEPGYLLAYILEPSEKKTELIEKLARECGLRALVLGDAGSIGNKDTTFEYWLSCFAGADRIITDSFHGTCFSMIFGKPFISIKARQKDRFGRLAEVAGESGSKSFLESEDEAGPEAGFAAPDYDEIADNLMRESEKSLGWLRDALEAPLPKAQGDTPPDLLVDYIRLLKQEISLSRMLEEGNLVTLRGIRIEVRQKGKGGAPVITDLSGCRGDVQTIYKKNEPDTAVGFAIIPNAGNEADIGFDIPEGSGFFVKAINKGRRDMDGGLHRLLIRVTGVTIDGRDELGQPQVITVDDQIKIAGTAGKSGHVSVHIGWSDNIG